MAAGRTVLIGGAGLVIAGLASLWLLQDPPAPQAPLAAGDPAASGPRPPAESGPDQSARAQSLAQPGDARPAAPASLSDPAAPSRRSATLDVARVERDGEAVFAGTAEPGAEIEVRIGEVVIATARAGADGGFVAYGAVPPGDGAQQLDVWTRSGEAGAVRAPDAVVVMAPPRGDAPDRAAGAGAPPPEETATVVLTRPEGAAVVQAPVRPADQPVTLDLVSYSDDGFLEISGRAEALRRLRVYANAVMIAETWVAADGRWSTRAAAGLAPGDYRLRVDLLGDDGAVRSRTESPFRREAVEVAALAAGQIVVQPGDTLWAIAENRYGQGVRYSVIYQANAARIRDPDLIYPGQIFSLPDTGAPQ